MRITIDNKLYFKPINISSKSIKLTKINRKLINVSSKVWPLALGINIHYVLWISSIRIKMFLN